MFRLIYIIVIAGSPPGHRTVNIIYLHDMTILSTFRSMIHFFTFRKDREALGEEGVDTERRRKKKKSKRSSFETEEVRSSAGYTNTVVDMSHEEHYNY